MPKDSRTATVVNKSKGFSVDLSGSGLKDVGSNSTSEDLDIGLTANNKPESPTIERLIRSSGFPMYNVETSILDIIEDATTTKILLDGLPKGLTTGKVASGTILLDHLVATANTTISLYDKTAAAWVDFAQDSTPTGNQWKKSNSKAATAKNLKDAINNHANFSAITSQERDTNHVIQVSQSGTGTAGNTIIKINTSNSDSKATATIKGIGAISVGKYIKLVSSDGTQKKYVAKAAESLADNEFEASGDIETTMTSLKDCIEHASGHNGSITVVASSSPGEQIDDTLTLTQAISATEHSSGDTIILNDLNNVVINGGDVDDSGSYRFVKSNTGFTVLSDFKGGENPSVVEVGGINPNTTLAGVLNGNTYTVSAISTETYGSTNSVAAISIAVNTSSGTYTSGTDSGWVGVPSSGLKSKFELDKNDLSVMVETLNSRINKVVGWTSQRIQDNGKLQDSSVVAATINDYNVEISKIKHGGGTSVPADGKVLTSNAASSGGLQWATPSSSTSYWLPQWSSRWKTMNDDWYRPSSSYGASYYHWTVKVSTNENLPTTWGDNRSPSIIVPKNCTLKSYHWKGYTTSANTIQLALLTGTPSYGTSGDTSLSQVGSTQTENLSANIQEEMKETGLSVSLTEGDMLIPMIRRSSNISASIYYLYGIFNIVAEVS